MKKNPMTRINADIDPSLLERRHLVAELREIAMVPASLKRSLRTLTPESILPRIPKEFTLNDGHVLFFYDKIEFLRGRFKRLCEEMENRDYHPDWSREVVFNGFDDCWNNDWEATDKDNQIVWDRIGIRIQEKPHLYDQKV